MSILFSQFIPPSPLPPYPHVRSLCLHLYSCPANMFIIYHFSRFYIYALIYDICFSLVIWCLSLVLCLDCFFFFVCVSIIDFWFAVPMRFWYSSLYMYKIVLSCWSLNFQCISNILHLYSPHDCWFWYHICVWMISYLYYMFAFTGELSHS